MPEQWKAAYKNERVPTSWKICLTVVSFQLKYASFRIYASFRFNVTLSTSALY